MKGRARGDFISRSSSSGSRRSLAAIIFAAGELVMMTVFAPSAPGASEQNLGIAEVVEGAGMAVAEDVCCGRGVCCALDG
jgi:hypothetical protein